MPRKYASNTLGREVGVVDLTDLAGPDLVKLYQELTGSPVGKFRDRATGVARVTAPLEGAIAKMAPAPPVSPTGLSRPRAPYNYAPPGTPVRETRPGTKRAKLIEIFSTPEGATFEEAAAATQWPYKILQENIRLLWSAVGWGLSEDGATGKIRVVGPS